MLKRPRPWQNSASVSRLEGMRSEIAREVAVRIRLLRFELGIALLAVAWPVAGQTRWTIPGAILAFGLNGTHFVSDVTATNPGTTPANVTVTMLPAQGSTSQAVSLAPGQTVVYRNVIGGLFGLSSAVGALTVDSTQPLLLRARTYNDAGPGTYGVALPVVAEDRLLAAGEQADTFWISQDAAGDSGYRTNVAVAFPDGGGSAIVTVFDANGQQVGEHVFSVDSAGFQQVSVGSFAGAVPLGRATVRVTKGRATAYAVVADNVTGDSSLFTFGDLPAGRQDVVVNGVARVNGKNGTFFRTDARFYNPTNTDATVTVAFHANGSTNPSPIAKNFVVPAGKVAAMTDVLDALLGLPVGSTGALRFKSDWPVAVLCRTSNVDPSGVKPGTFGFQQVPVPLLSFLTSADAGAAATGIRQNAAYRTNLGFAAGADGATCALTLETSAGGAVGTASVNLGPFGWTQGNVQDLFSSASIPDDATVIVRVIQGSADVYDSSTDNTSGDSVLTPIAALPANIPSSATIGPAGGSIRSSDGRLTLRIPAGALSAPVPFSLQPATTGAPQAVGSGYRILPTGTGFAKPALLTLAYGPDETDGSSADALTLAESDPAGWAVLTGGSVDPVRHTLTVPVATAQSPLGMRPEGRVPQDYPGAGFVAVIRSWEFVPSGRLATVVDGRLNFTVNFVGYSSSLIDPGQGRLFLSSSPSEVQVSWFLNNAEPGLHPEDGGIVKVGTSATYVAPHCPPSRNPVLVTATMSNGGLFALVPYSPTGRAHVRVLYRQWTFKSTLEQTFTCPKAFAADQVTYTAGFSFTLDDNLNATNVQPDTATTVFFGDPTACDSSDRSLSRIGIGQHTITLTSGRYDGRADWFDLVFDGTFPTALGYSYVSVAPDGTTFPGTSGPGPIVPVPGYELFFEGEGVVSDLGLSAFGFWSVELRHAASSGCP
jgi:hypothetical protein